MGTRITYYSVEVLYQENSFQHIASGNIGILLGSASPTSDYSFNLSNGKISFSGVYNFEMAHEPIDSVVALSGVADISIVLLSYTAAMTGKIAVTNYELAAISVVYFAEGVIALSGTSLGVFGQPFSSTGTIFRVQGVGVTQSTYKYEPEGNLLIAGLPLIASGFIEHFGNGRLLFTSNGGSAGDVSGFIYDTTGAVAFKGFSFLPRAVESDGVFSLRGSASYSVTCVVEKSFTWKVREVQTIIKEFTWAVGTRPQSYFRVTGKCKPAKCPPLGNLDCDVTYVVNVLARNISEVCKKLKRGNFRHPIAKIEKFSLPANKSDFPTDVDETELCNVLEDVTPDFTYTECVDLLIDYIGIAGAAVQSFFVLTFSHDYSSGVNLTGVADCSLLITKSVTGQGSTFIQGEFTCEMSSYVYNPTGAITLSADKVDLALQHWVHSPFGGAVVVGGITNCMLILSQWAYVPSAQLTLSGVNDITAAAMTYGMSKVTTFTGTGLDESSYQPLNYIGSGSLAVTGIVTCVLQHYFYLTSGVLTLSGVTFFVSSAYTIYASGSLLWGGGEPYAPTGRFGLNGTASVVLNQNPNNGGRLSLGGQASVYAPIAVMIGHLGVTGEADVECSDLGIVVVGSLGVGSSIEAENILFAYVDAPAITASTKRVSLACCDLLLPSVFNFDHEFGNTNVLSHFIKRNRLVFPTSVSLVWNRNSELWTYTGFFSGLSANSDYTENWNINFQFKCITNSAVPAFGGTAWEFNMLVSVTDNVGRRKATRLRLLFSAPLICNSSNPINFKWSFLVQSRVTVPSTIDGVVFFDEIGLFKSQAYLTDDEIVFIINEAVGDALPPQNTINIEPSISRVIHFAADLVPA